MQGLCEYKLLADVVSFNLKKTQTLRSIKPTNTSQMNQQRFNNILLIHPNDETADEIKQNITCTVDVQHVKTTQEAYKALEDQIFDAVVTDYAVSSEDKILEIIDTHSNAHPPVPIIIYTNTDLGDISPDLISGRVTGFIEADAANAIETLSEKLTEVIDGTENRDSLWMLRRYKHLIENMGDGVYSIDTEGRFLFTNDALSDLLGYEPGGMVGESVQTAMSPESFEKRTNAVEKLVKEDVDNITYEIELKDAYGNIIPAEVDASLIRNNGKYVGSVGVVRDISERKHFEEKLTLLNEVTRDMMEMDSEKDIFDRAVSVAANFLDIPITTIHTYNDNTETLEPVASTPEAKNLFGETLPQFDADGGSLAWENFQNQESQYYKHIDEQDDIQNEETEVVSEIQIPLSDHGIFLAGTTDDVMDTTYGRLQLAEILGATVQVAIERADRQQKLEDYRDELETTIEQLKESNEELEQFAYIASHDLQEPLRMISSYLDLLKMEYGDELGNDADEYIEYAVDGSERMKRLIDGLLTFSRVETDEREFEPLDPNTILDGVRNDLQLRIEENDATLTVADNIPAIEADENQMGQLFQNLIKNAIKYTRDGVPPEVEIRAENAGDMVQFHVQDNGRGIPDDQQERIFEVFTRGEDETDDSGTGIGLAVCRRIVQGHGGEMNMDSTVGEGTTFHFTLPKQGDN